MNHEVSTEFRHDDEIDLYELIEILVRHKMTIVLTTILCVLLSLGAALYVRSNKIDFLIKDIVISQDTFGLKGANILLPEGVLLKDDNVKKLLEIEALKAEYLKNTPNELQSVDSERKFLSEVLTIIKDDKRPGIVKIKAEIVADRTSSVELINRYIDILKSEDNTKNIIESEIELKIAELQRVEKELETIQTELLAIFKNDSDLRALKPEEKSGFLSFKYPTLMMRRVDVEKYYNNYSNELVRLTNLNTRYEVVKSSSDIYLERGTSKAKLILAVGSVLGVFLGIMLAFLKEFVDGYKKRYQK